MSLKDITITASINSIPTQSYGQKTYIASSDEQSFPIETIDGGNGGSMPNLFGQTSSVDLFVNITQSWPVSIDTPVGLVSFTHEDQSEFIDGEFSGSVLTVTTQSLNPECWPILFESQPDINYSMFPYIDLFVDGDTESTSYFTFINPLTAPRDGEFLVHFNAYETTSPPQVTYNIDYIKVARIDHEGKDNTLSLQDLTNFIWVDPTVGKIDLVVINIFEYTDYYLYKVTSKTWTKNLISPYFTDDNFLDYKLEATSTYSDFPIPSNEFVRLTQSWTETFDNANGFSNGQYVFPLSPNLITQITASINVYIDDITPGGSSSIVLAVNEYNNTTNTPTSILSNTWYLAPGNHSLTISGSTYQPIQTYKYEVNAKVSEPDITFNPTLINPISNYPYNTYWPSDWGTYFDNINTPQYNSPFNSLLDPSGPITIFSPLYPGGFYLGINPSDTWAIAHTGSKIPGVPMFKTGSKYQVNITIPTESYDAFSDMYYGPPSAWVTCSWNLDNAMANTNVIGHIPSGTSGVVSFDFIMPNNTTPQDIGSNFTLFCPPGTSVQDGLGKNHNFTVLEIKINSSSSVGLDSPSFNITQSQVPQLSTSSIVLEPYLFENFTNSDCNVLMNNAELSEYDKDFMKVNYDDGILIPTNQQQIISGTAEPAPVKAYNYRILSQTLPRYDGVRVVQQKDNIWTPGDISFSQTPSVTDLQTYFAYFDFVQSTTSELINKSAVHILYLIDKDGVIQTPTLSGSYYYNLIDNFETDKNANIIVEGENGNRVYIGNKKVIRPGAIPRAILESQTGSAFNIQNIIEWTTETSNTPNFISRFTWPWNSGAPAAGGLVVGGNSTIEKTLPITLETVPSNEVDIIPNNNYIVFNNTSLSTTINLSTKIEAYGHVDTPRQYGGVRSVYFNAILQKSTDGVNWNTIQTISNIYAGNVDTSQWNYNASPQTNIVNWTSFTPKQGDKYRIRIYNGSGYESVVVNPINTILIVNQNPAPAISPVSYAPLAYPPLVYWTTGSNSKNILTSSALFPAYIQNPPPTQTSYSASGYGPNLPFTIQKFSDSIRFEGNENYSFQIFDAFTSTNTSSFNPDFTTWYNNNVLVWTVNSTSATCTGVGSNAYITQSISYPLTDNELFYINFTLAGVTGPTPGFIIDFDGAYPSQTPASTPGTLGYYINSSAWITPLANGTYSIPFKVPTTAPLNPDYIRITGSNANVLDSFTISDIYLSANTQNSLYLKLDKEIDDIININSFLIRRLNPHPNFITIDNQVVSGSGYIFSEYSTDELKQNFDNIIVSLKERGLT